MRHYFVVTLVVILLGSAGSVRSQDPYWGFLLHPEELADTLHAEVSQFSSYDRNGGNDDYANFLSIDPDGFRVMCDVTGPGVLTHMWCTQRSIPDTMRWKIYVDNGTVPLFDLPIHELFGHHLPFTPPLCDTVNYSRYSYVPIPFAGRLKITSHMHGGIYYQLEVLRYVNGTPITSLTNPPSADYLARLDSLQERFANPAQPPELGGAVQVIAGTRNVSPAVTDTMVGYTGNGTCRRVMLLLGEHTAALHDSLWIRVYSDDYPLPVLNGPVNSLFGAASGWRPFQSAVSGMSGDTLYLNLPLPFKQSLRVEAENRTATTQAVTAVLEVVARAESEVKPFRLQSFYQQAASNPAFRLYEVLNQRGAGNFVGMFWQMIGTDHRTIEGDEAIYLNGANSPQWRGTGIEGYFNGGYLWTNLQGQVDPHQLTAHGCLYLGGGQAAAYRWHVADPVPFADGLRMTLECGGYREVPANYQTTAFYYAPLPRWAVSDVSGDGQSYPGEPLRFVGYGLAPQSWLEGATWGGTDLVLTNGDTEVRASGVIDFTVISPVGLDGTAALTVRFANGTETAAADWRVSSTPLFTFRPERMDADSLVFMADTLSVSLHGIPAGQSATIQQASHTFAWVDPSVIADLTGRLEGRVVIPAGLPVGELVLRSENNAVADHALKHYQLIRYEAEDLVTTAWRGSTYSDRFAPTWTPAGQSYPWGRNVVRWLRGTGIGDSLSLAFTFPDSGNYRTCYFFAATTGATIVQTLIDGVLDVVSFDTYRLDNGWRIARTDTVWGQWRVIGRGPHTLTVKVTGRNDAATAWETWFDQFAIGSEFPQDARERPAELPGRFTLEQNYPNPFNPSTQFSFTVPRASDVRIVVYDLLGRQVELLADRHYHPGEYTLTWDASALASGLYFVRLEAPQTQIVRKAMLLR
ncbi:DUF2961 domain-containing protein [candidate division KSB1 bacterium]|nr:DUF2961 domain-containing protein [candidate division KSB1 bacterium]